MGCDIHTTVCIRDRKDPKMFIPVYGTINGPYVYKMPIEPRYFRNYNAFGILSGEVVRGGTIFNCFVDDDVPPNFDVTKYFLPLKNRFPFENIIWSTMGFDGVKEFVPDLTLDKAYAIWDEYCQVDDALQYNLRSVFAFNALEYYSDKYCHSHNYFSLTQLNKLVKRMYTLAHDQNLSSCTKTEITGLADILNGYRKDIQAIARLACGFYDEAKDEDVLVLICFDS